MGLFTKRNKELESIYNQLTGLAGQVGGYGDEVTSGLRGLYGQVGQGPLSMAANQYMQGILGGQGLNPYEAGSPYQSYQTAALQNFQRNIAPQITQGFAGSGMLRGSSARNASQGALTDFANQLQQQGYGAYQQGLARQYGIAQYAPQMELSQINTQAGLLGMIPQYSPAALQANILSGAAPIAQQMYEPTGLAKLLGAGFQLGGTALGAAGLAGGFGNLFNFQRTQPYRIGT